MTNPSIPLPRSSVESAEVRRSRSMRRWAGLTTAVGLGAVTLALNAPEVNPPAPAPITGEPAPDFTPQGDAEPYQVQQGDNAWSLAANRTPEGHDTTPLETYIQGQATEDGNPGLHPYDPQNGTGDVIEGLPPTLPVNEDANPSNNTPQ